MIAVVRTSTWVCLVASTCLAADPSESGIPLYAGRQACLACHDRPPHACTLEAIAEHARAREALSTPEARHIAAVSGVAGPPAGSRVCLECHATGADAGPRWAAPGFDPAAGVECEACHGPGSLHADTGGELPAIARVRPGDRSQCATCHRPRPSHDAVLEWGYRRPGIDAKYHTPVSLAVGPDGELLFVVCANTDRVLVVETATGVVVDEIEVGRTPHAAAASPDGRTLYVTNRLDDSVSVVEIETRRVVAEVRVGDDPHGVLASDRLVHVANTGESTISVLDAATLTETVRLAGGPGPWALAAGTGDAVYATNVRPHLAPFREPHRSELTVLGSRVRDRLAVPDANMLQGIAPVPGRPGVVLFTLMRTKNLVPITRLAQGWTITNGLGVAWPDGRVDQVLLDEPAESFPDPMDVAVSPDGRHALVTSGGSDRVAVVDVEALLAAIRDAPHRELLPDHLGTSRAFVVKRVAVGRNPRGVLFSPDGRRVWVANALDDSVTVIETDGFTVAGTIDLGGPDRISETRRGERLFHSASITFGRQFSCRSCHPDGHVNGLTFDIEADGIGMSPVDNRTLRGILDTAPFKWEGNNPTLQRQCGPRLAVFFTRLSPYTPRELAALVHYICTIELPPNRHRRAEGLTAAQRRGKAIFERIATNDGVPIPVEKRCTTCHHGPYRNAAIQADVGTTMWFDAPVETAVVDLGDVSLDTEQYGELGLYYYLDTGTPTRDFDAPHLTNVCDGPPYLHNGAAETLHEIWTRFDVLGMHGATGDLTRRQLNDLIAYLESL